MTTQLKAHVIGRIARDLRASDYGMVESHGCSIRKAAASVGGQVAYWVAGSGYNNALKAASVALAS